MGTLKVPVKSRVWALRQLNSVIISARDVVSGKWSMMFIWRRQRTATSDALFILLRVDYIPVISCRGLTGGALALGFISFPAISSPGMVSQVVRWGRSVFANIQKFIQFQLTVNVVALSINLISAMSSGEIPLNAVQVSQYANSGPVPAH